ncbi:molybdenum cofactor biosynthesis protein A [Salmonella enterica subsp. enterica]|nr:molybdenum cofactor biosynthesis protein A [Salmonella enterica subsp. enterica]
MKFVALRALLPVLARRRCVLPAASLHYAAILPTSLPPWGENDAIRQIAVTTNGYRLARDAANWREAGLTGVNVSVDSLDARQFHAITGQDKFRQVMAGIDAAFDAGFEKVKVNTVLMRDVNHHQLDTFLAWIQPRPIQLRFIELMETARGAISSANIIFRVRYYVTS